MMNAFLIGNSYTSTNNLNLLLEGLLKSDKEGYQPVRVSSFTMGGRRFDQHLDDANGVNGENQLRTWLVTDPPVSWNWVVLQEQSQTPGFGNTKYDYWYNKSRDAAVGLDKHINEKGSAGAGTIFFMTWGHRDGARHNPDLYPDFLTMNAKIKAGYEGYVKATTGDSRTSRAAPVGPAFERIYRDIEATGDDPLQVGSEFYNLYMSDGSHPSLTGSYLAACVLYATMTDQDPRGSSYKPDGLSTAQQTRLQQVAYMTVKDYHHGRNLATTGRATAPTPADEPRTEFR